MRQAILAQLLPRSLDNTYRGQRAGLWIFAALIAIKVLMGANSALNAYSVASSADGIPLATFTPAAAQTVVSLFATVGFSQFVLGILGVFVLARYRAAIPLVFALLVMEHLGRELVHQIVPAATTSSPAFLINAGLFALEVVGLALSLRPPTRPRTFTEQAPEIQ